MQKLSVLVLLSLCVSANAQMGMNPQDSMQKMLTSTGRLLNQNDFKKELKLTGDQNKKISALTKNQEKKTQELLRKGGSDMNASIKAMAELDALDEETDKAIQAELTPEQARRLTEIKWQILGVKAIYDPVLQKELGLSEEQAAKLDSWKAGEGERMMALMDTGGNPHKLKDARKKLKDDDDKNIKGVLLPDQLTKYKTALGAECKAAKRLSDMMF